ncbi:hypothetical protein B0H13DRAFT_1911442 [Mycena leptocephala]|nr:hypothetical protein B0H13DRAFT_1911442 [Mycena leptocephala]
MSQPTAWVLIPGTILALITILVVLVAVADHAGDAVGEPLDPAMHRAPASSAGDNGHLCDVAERGGSDFEVGERVKRDDTTDHTTSVLRHRRTRSAGVTEGEL